jgi:hypothetical protein
MHGQSNVQLHVSMYSPEICQLAIAILLKDRAVAVPARIELFAITRYAIQLIPRRRSAEVTSWQYM